MSNQGSYIKSGKLYKIKEIMSHQGNYIKSGNLYQIREINYIKSKKLIISTAQKSFLLQQQLFPQLIDVLDT